MESQGTTLTPQACLVVDGRKVNDTCTFSCQTGYELTDPQNNKLTCLDTGSWDAAIISCQRKWRNWNLWVRNLFLKLITNASSLTTLEIMNVTVFGNLILINTDFLYDFFFLRFLLSFSFDREVISNIQGSIWPNFQTPQSSSKILRYASHLQHCFYSLEIWWITVVRAWYIAKSLKCIF